jgi:anaerobic ribonucleoside-triphosphate reductase
MTEQKYKCHTCHIVINESDLIGGNCPKCESNFALKPMCENDTLACEHDIVDGLAYCPECGEPCCPECGCHDVSQISRVTGYLQEVSGWNAGKQQELKDRHRVNISDESGMI